MEHGHFTVPTSQNKQCLKTQQEDPFFIQTFLLRFFGFIHPATKSLRYRTVHTTALLLFLLAVLCGVLFQAGAAVHGGVTGIFGLRAISHSDAGGNSFLIQLISDLPDCFYTARAFSVLIVFFAKRNVWSSLHRDVGQFLSQAFQAEDVRDRLIRKLRNLSVIFTAVTFFLHAVFASLDWLRGWSDGIGNDTVTYSYYTFVLTESQLVAIWFPLMDVPFLLSQQVLISVIITACFLVEVTHLIRNGIQAEIKRLEVAGGASTNSCERLHRQVRRWIFLYVTTWKIVEEVNECFGWVLFVMAGFDVLATLGAGANFVKPDAYLLSNWDCGLYATTCVIFTSYATIFFLPFVFLHEQSQMIYKDSQHLVWILERHMAADKTSSLEDQGKASIHQASLSELMKLLRTISAVSHLNDLVVEAGGLFHITRASVTAVITSVSALLLIAREVLKA